MKKTLSTLAMALTLGSAVFLSACSGSNAGAQPSAPSVTIPELPSYPIGPAGSTLKIWTSPKTFGEITVSKPEVVGEESLTTRVFVSVKALQGGATSISDFSVINSEGMRINQFPREYNDPGALNEDAALVQGETRTGYVYFPLTGVTKIYLGADYGTKAAWSVK